MDFCIRRFSDFKILGFLPGVLKGVLLFLENASQSGSSGSAPGLPGVFKAVF